MSLTDRLANRWYPNPESCNPPTQVLRDLERLAQPSWRVLDLGAGAGVANPHTLKDRCAEVCGVDLDERVCQNPLLHRGVVSDVSHLPFPDDYFDLVFSIYVLEHISDPQVVLAEVGRVLKPGGLFIALTPNLFHYVALAARLTPHAFHEWMNRSRGRAAEDTFQTAYRMNTRGALGRQLRRAGFEEPVFQMVEVRPNYLMSTLPTFLLGVLYERVVNSTSLLSGLRVNIALQCRKRNDTSASPALLHN